MKERIELHRLAGIHLTPCGWLPAPDPSRGWCGWLEQGPRDYLVHPLALASLTSLIRESLEKQGIATTLHDSGDTEAITARESAKKLRVQPPSKEFPR